MPYTHITTTRNGAEAIRYARGLGRGHNASNARNVFVSGVNMLPDEVIPFEAQMQIYWNRASVMSRNQVLRVIQSFAPQELDPKKEEDIHKGHMIGIELARKLYPGHQVAVFTQIDGKGGLIHNHIIPCNVHMTTNKGIPNTGTWHGHIEQVSDEIYRQYFDLYKPEPARDKVTQAVRVKREKREELIRERDRLLSAGMDEEASKIEVPYIWQDDLKARVREAAAAATDEDDFFKQLTLRGVEGKKREATRKQPRYYLYELTDVSGFPDLDSIPKNLKSKSYKLGVDFQPEGVAQLFQKTKTGVRDYAPKIDLTESRQSDEKASGNTERPPEGKTPEIASETPQKGNASEGINWSAYDKLKTGKTKPTSHKTGGKTGGKVLKPVSDEKAAADPEKEALRIAAAKRKEEAERQRQQKIAQVEASFGDLAKDIEAADDRLPGS